MLNNLETIMSLLRATMTHAVKEVIVMVHMSSGYPFINVIPNL